MPTRSASKPSTSMTSRADAFTAFLDEQHKNSPGEFRTLDDNSIVDVEVYSTGALSLDVALGVGGLPKGRIIEIFGTPGGGKTTLALSTAVSCQKAGGYVGFVDCEHALSVDLAKNMGIDPARFVILQPTSGEDAIDKVVAMLESKAFDMVVVDSIAAMVPQRELDDDSAQASMGQHAKLIARFMRKVTSLVSESDSMLLCLNQTRKSLGSYFVTDTPTGGNALPFASSVRINVRTSNSQRIERDGKFIGTTATVTVLKNKVYAPFREASVDIIYGQGVHVGGSVLSTAEEYGVITRKGSSYTETETGVRFAIGKDNAKQAIEDDVELRDRLTERIYTILRTGNPTTATINDTPEETDELDVLAPTGT